MGNKRNQVATLHSRGTFKVKPEKFEEFKALVVESQRQIEAKIMENGPMSWDASFDMNNSIIFIDSVYENEEALLFHQNNIKKIVQDAMPLLDGPPESVDSEVFSYL